MLIVYCNSWTSFLHDCICNLKFKVCNFAETIIINIDKDPFLGFLFTSHINKYNFVFSLLRVDICK